MDTTTANTRKGLDRYGPYVLAIPFAAILFGFYGTFLPFGLLSIAGFALGGVLWALLLGFVANRVMRRETWRQRLANGSLFVSIIALGLMIGGGLMYILMMFEAVNEPSTTYATLSALMQPAVPYFIVINTLLELFIMLLVLFSNWNEDRRRRNYALIGVGLYLVIRIWTYLVYAENRLTISTETLSLADVEWFTRTLSTDYRVGLELIAQASLILAAMVPFQAARNRES